MENCWSGCKLRVAKDLGVNSEECVQTGLTFPVSSMQLESPPKPVGKTRITSRDLDWPLFKQIQQ